MSTVFHLTYEMRIQLAGRTEYHTQTAGYTLDRAKAEAHKTKREGNDFCEVPITMIEVDDLDSSEQDAYYEAQDMQAAIERRARDEKIS